MLFDKVMKINRIHLIECSEDEYESRDEHPIIFENPNTIYVRDEDYTLEDYIRDNANPDKMECIKDTETERVWKITNRVRIGAEYFEGVTYIIEFPHVQENFADYKAQMEKIGCCEHEVLEEARIWEERVGAGTLF